MNGYFRLITTQKETALQLIPPTEDGAAIDINEITAYLQLQYIYDVDMKAIYSALKDLKAPVAVRLCGALKHEADERVQLRLTDDKMKAVGRFYPPSTNGNRMSREEIVQDLKARNINGTIAEETIAAFLENPVYCTDIVLAFGEAVVQGKDAQIEYRFRTELDTKPARNPDGSVDFFHLNTICHCKEGDVLAVLIKEERGKPGRNLLGEILMPKEVKTKKLKFGNNIKLSEDGTTLTSMLNGHVSLVEGKVFVSDVYEVENVGPSTGNIESEGSVVVNGNVQAGYAIKAKGNVIVKGVVEGAVIEAGGDIILSRGMNGMGKGVLRAGGSVISKFFENSTIYSGSFVEADSILHSNVIAETEINVDGRKGFIAGGSVRATNKVSCKTLGSAMGADTFVEVGIDPNQKIKHQELQKEMMDIQRNLKNIQPILLGLSQKVKSGAKLSVEQLKYLQNLMDTNVKLTERLAECENEYELLDEHLQKKDNACVCVREEAYSDTKITIKDASLILKKSVSFCRFIYEKGEVKTYSY